VICEDKFAKNPQVSPYLCVTVNLLNHVQTNAPFIERVHFTAIYQWYRHVRWFVSCASVKLQNCKYPILNSVLFSTVVRSTDSDTVFDEKYETEERSSKRWRKRRSMYQATDSTDSLSDTEVSYLLHTTSFLWSNSVTSLNRVQLGLLHTDLDNKLMFSAAPVSIVWLLTDINLCVHRYLWIGQRTFSHCGHYYVYTSTCLLMAAFNYRLNLVKLKWSLLRILLFSLWLSRAASETLQMKSWKCLCAFCVKDKVSHLVCSLQHISSSAHCWLLV